MLTICLLSICCKHRCFYVLCEYIPYISKTNSSTSYGIGTTKRDCNDDVNDNDNKNRMKQMTPRK